EDERIVDRAVNIGVGLEGGDQHPVKRKRGEKDEQRNDEVVESDSSCASHYSTSERRAIRSKIIATPNNTGSMKITVAAPSARLPLSIPLKYAQLASTCVALFGPPLV